MRLSSIRSARFLRCAVVVSAIASTASSACGQTPQYPPQQPPQIPAAAENDVVPAAYNAPLRAAPSPLDPVPPVAPAPLAPAAPLGKPAGSSAAKLPLPGADKSPAGASRGGGWLSVLASLGFVLGLFLVCVRLLRRGMPQTTRPLPKEAVETLGRMPLPGRRQGQLLRVGNKVILVSFSTGGADVLVEIDDPAEVDRLAGLCAATDPHGATQSFRGIVENFFREKPGVPSPNKRSVAAREDEVA